MSAPAKKKHEIFFEKFVKNINYIHGVHEKSDRKMPCGMLISTLAFLACIVLIAYPLAMLAIGAQNINNCTINTYIPIWLIVDSIGLIVFVFFFYILVMSFLIGFDSEWVVFLFWGPYVLTSIVAVFNLAWLTAGNVWVYSVRYQVDFVNSSSSKYCDPLLYKFTYWTLIVRWILWLIMVLASVFGCIGFVISRFVSNKNRD